MNYDKLSNLRTAKRDAQRLFDAGEDKWGTDEETFNLIFATRDFYQLRAIYQQYVKVNMLSGIEEARLPLQKWQVKQVYSSWMFLLIPFDRADSPTILTDRTKFLSFVLFL